jgi:hypothetical protein
VVIGPPRAAAPIPATRPTAGALPVISAAAAAAASVENGERIHVPTERGEVTLTIRSMFRKRAGRPRSPISSAAPVSAPPAAPSRATRARCGRPVATASCAITAEAPAVPPVKKYVAIAGAFHVGALRTGLP